MNKATIITLAAAMLPALSQAQAYNICDRTPQVRDAILREVDANDCSDVNLGSVERLSFYNDQLTTLQAGDFHGLTELISVP